MPYIKQEDRKKFEEGISLIVNNIENEGDLNYVFSKICAEYIKNRVSKKLEKYSYSLLARCVSALENAKLEFYRKVLSPYENKKECDNGAVYEFD